MPFKLTIQDCIKYAESHNGKVLSETYVNGYVKLEWECSEGHQWSSCFQSMKQHNCWCRICSIEGRKNKNAFQKSIEKAKSKGGLIISSPEDYKNAYSKLKWECKNQHQFEATYNNVVNQDKWCPHCAGILRLSIAHCKKLAAEKEGECLSKEYVNAHRLLIWKCKNAHQWTSNVNNITSGNWCPYCSSLRSEKLSREILERLLECRFEKCRPDWLDKLELDGYNEDREIAFEYQGIQHYKFVKHFHRTKEAFRDLQERDARKYRLCMEEGISLVLIPYEFNFRDPDKLERYVKDQLITHGFLGESPQSG